MKRSNSFKLVALSFLLGIPKAFAVDIDIPEDPGDPLFLDMYLPYLAILAVGVAYLWLKKNQKATA